MYGQVHFSHFIFPYRVLFAWPALCFYQTLKDCTPQYIPNSMTFDCVVTFCNVPVTFTCYEITTHSFTSVVRLTACCNFTVATYSTKFITAKQSSLSDLYTSQWCEAQRFIASSNSWGYDLNSFLPTHSQSLNYSGNNKPHVLSLSSLDPNRLNLDKFQGKSPPLGHSRQAYVYMDM